jgi:hypothetical protein
VSAGYQITKATLDNTLGQEIGTLWTALDAVNRRNTWLNDSSHSDANLLTPLGYTGSEITTLRAAFTDLNKLWQISHAAATQAAANDFFFNAKLLGGINWYG